MVMALHAAGSTRNAGIRLHATDKELWAMASKREKATRQILDHLDRVQQMLTEFRVDGVSTEGILMRPHFHTASLKVAREELSKAIALAERTKWGTLD